MKLSLGNKVLAIVFLALSYLAVLNGQEDRSFETKQPTDLLERIAKYGIPYCGEATARYQLKDAHAVLFKELALPDRELLRGTMVTTLERVTLHIKDPRAIVFIGRYEAEKIPEFSHLPMFLIFLRAGGEGVCLLGAVVGQLPVHEEIARQYENR